MYTRLAAAERKAWSRSICTYEAGPKEPLFASLTQLSEYAGYASTLSVSIDNPHGKVDALRSRHQLPRQFLCSNFNSGIHHINLYLAEKSSGSMNEVEVYAPGKNLACAQIWDSDTGFCNLTQETCLCRASNSSLGKRKVAQSRIRCCFACGSVPLDDGNDSPQDGGVDVELCGACSSIPRGAVCEPTIHGAQSSMTSTTHYPPVRKFNASSDLVVGFAEGKAEEWKAGECDGISKDYTLLPLERCSITGLALTTQSSSVLLCPEVPQ